ncbi:MAG: hypothetical protein L0332_07780 [Chloroflexi bacterium]|nr:hypothetical protein [Chloroflexota bacterium]MCI0575229.1 hypothetical protein [Chloroflexota bacterium]MCI0648850.1 hypothetical protein [Chloroflexota bacterium]MCI0726605.1 hypothetical protein [Chloroflexota bacterium]
MLGRRLLLTGTLIVLVVLIIWLPGFWLLLNLQTFLPFTVSFQEVGAGSASEDGISGSLIGHANDPSMAVSPENVPYIAWAAYHGENYQLATVYLRYWDGSTWVEVGCETTGGNFCGEAGFSNLPSIAFSSDGTLYLAWMAGSGESEIYVQQLKDGSWQEVGAGSASGGGISSTPGDSINPSLAVTSDGTLYVVWEDILDDSYQLYVRRWQGTTWEEVGSDSASKQGINRTQVAHYPQIALDSTGTPYVSWVDSSSGRPFVYIRRWNGVDWEEVGPGSASGTGLGSGGDFSLVLSPDGIPYVAWTSTSPKNFNPEVKVSRWSSASLTWESIDPKPSTQRSLNISPALAFAPDGKLYLAWVNSSIWGEGIFVVWWNGNKWEEVAWGSGRMNGIGGRDTFNSDPFIAVDMNGTVYVTWLARHSFRDLNDAYVRRWQG